MNFILGVPNQILPASIVLHPCPPHSPNQNKNPPPVRNNKRSTSNINPEDLTNNKNTNSQNLPKQSKKSSNPNETKPSLSGSSKPSICEQLMRIQQIVCGSNVKGLGGLGLKDSDEPGLNRIKHFN